MSADSADVVKSGEVKVEAIPVSHRVVVFGVPDEPEALEHLLAALPDMDRVTARQQARLLPGIIPQSLPQHTAAMVAAEIRRLGLNAAAVPSCEVPDFSHARQTHHVRISDGAFDAMDTSDKPQSSPWNTVSVISVGVVPSTAAPGYRSSPGFSSGSSHRLWHDGVRMAAKHRPEAFLVLNDGQSVLNIASDEMNYEYLEGRLNTSSSANFRLLIRDLVAHAAKAWITPSTRAFLDRSPVPHYEFRSREDFRRYTEFQTLVSNQPGNQR